ncbi:MAG: DUF481 domain-containing protein, partial [Lysobacterales bacterium]
MNALLRAELVRGSFQCKTWGTFGCKLAGKWYYAGAVMFKKDRFADLNLRTLVGPGIGYRF